MIRQKDFRSRSKKRYGYKFLFLLLIPLALLIKGLMSLSPHFTEKFYTQGVYKYIMQPVSLFTGLFPFSVAEIALILLVIIVPIMLVVRIIHSVRRRQWSPFFRFIANIAMIGSIWFLVQFLVWNINYERLSFAENAQIEIRESSIDELDDLCRQLIADTNTLRQQVKEDAQGVMMLDGGFGSVAKRSKLAYEELQKQYEFLKGNYGRPKPVLLSRLMSHTNIIGIYSCLTGEANIDTDIPPMEIPSTTLHEMAHQRGFAREDEANYVAYLACMTHPDPDFKYSGSVLALQYSMNALYSADADRYFKLVETYSEGYLRDLRNEQEYWKQFQGITKKVASKVNDTYLKMNGESDGVKSYGRMVDLLLAEARTRKAVSPLP